MGKARHFTGFGPEVVLCQQQLDYESDPPLDDAQALAKQSTLNVAVSQLASDFDRESNLCLEKFSRTRCAAVISTGSLKLDLALGIGGLPKGRMVEIFGKEASGKTTLALHVVKEAQKNGGCCAYIDAENAFDPSFAEAIGVDTERLLIAQPNSAENSLSIVNTLVGGSIDVVIVDSVRTKKCSNQVPVVYKEVACGGNALGFYAAVRLRTSRRELRYSEDRATGIGISVQITKNKLAPAVLKEAGIDIKFGKGICHESEILEMASSIGVIVKDEPGYWINGSFLVNKAAAEKFLHENSAVADDICNIMRSQFFER
ncbi:hypothetical protein PR202_gb03785 [Eleusine coracana subsp. coracana]|uniref:Uncharacterized protein n=1 Tax=Eleusine coracana subsp. coracana TaxID=191504 RepID=A0AAV5E179_ELECO|nr:hypothetical protein PR202_gb03785 [Eleusine coracana subsp. coracana]